jgi:hypothetical protein
MIQSFIFTLIYVILNTKSIRYDTNYFNNGNSFNELSRR